jgi:hypothetical protein
MQRIYKLLYLYAMHILLFSLPNGFEAITELPYILSTQYAGDGKHYGR